MISIRFNRRSLLGAVVPVIAGASWTHSGAAQDAGQSGAFALSYSEFCESESVISCDYGNSLALFQLDGDFMFSRGIEPVSEDQPIFRISVEGIGDTSVDEVRTAALGLAPVDAVQVSEELWADGSVYQLFSSAWLAARYPTSPELWAGHAPGTFGVVLMEEIAQDKLARAVVTLPQARYSVQVVEEQVKPNGRGGFTLRAWVDATATVESKLIAFERALYEGFAQYPDYVFGVLFAYSEGNPEVVSGVTDVGRAAVSIDGKGFSGDESRSFLIQQDEDATLQAAVNTGLFEEKVYELAK